MIACRSKPLLILLGLAVVANVAASQLPAPEGQGEALPPGAVVRLGSARGQQAGNVGFAAFLPDGASVVTVGDDRTIRLWESPSGKELRQIALPAPGKAKGYFL